MDRALNRNAALVLGFVFLFAFLGFWPNYFAVILDGPNWRFHFHAVTLISWCVLMVLQAYLIRVNNRAMHRTTGRISYLLVPLVIVSSILLSHFQEKPKGLSEVTVYGVGIVANLLLQFTFAYGLAIYHRHKPALHARFMICTALPMIPPILDRVIIFYLLPREIAGFLPQIGGNPLYSLISAATIDVVLIVLTVWDWKSRRRLNVFPVVLGAFILFQSIMFFGHRWDGWRSFVAWYLELPLS